MLDEDTRRAIFTLHNRGHGLRAIARTLSISRNSVKKVLRMGTSVVPKVKRAEMLTEHIARIRELYADCKGNIVRVMEELEAREGVTVPYSTLTAMCRRHGIGVKEKQRAGQYHFDPGQEMQHDTSPHDVEVGGKLRRFQCASLVFCYSRRIYAQEYAKWDRFHCKIFLTKALKYFGASCDRCMLDNSSVIIAHGTGPDAVPAPEMAALADRFNFKFIAHKVGDANRSARVEGPFAYIEKNFYPGRTFADLGDLNSQFLEWCDKVNAKYSSKLRASRNELFAVERPHLNPLPLYIPEVYALHHRMVNLEGFITLHSNRYSAPTDLIGRQVEIRESECQVRIFEGPREVCVHRREEPGLVARSLLPEHREGARPRHSRRRQLLQEESTLDAAGEPFVSMMRALRKQRGGRAVRALRHLHRMYIEYPDEPLREALAEALHYGLLELERVERMVLRRVAGNIFRLRPPENDEGDPSNEG